MKLVLKIELNDETMHTGHEVARVLQLLVAELESEPELKDLEYADLPYGELTDIHGNKVGKWGVTVSRRRQHTLKPATLKIWNPPRNS